MSPFGPLFGPLFGPFLGPAAGSTPVDSGGLAPAGQEWLLDCDGVLLTDKDKEILTESR